MGEPRSLLEQGLQRVRDEVNALPAGVTRAFIITGDSKRQEARIGIIARTADGWHIAADLGVAKQEGFSVRGTVIKEF